MKTDEFEQLVAKAGLNLLSKWAPRFLVSLRVPTKFGGYRSQSGALIFALGSFSRATEDEVSQSINILKKNLLRASRTLSGDIGEGMVVQVETKQLVASAVGINYPAH
jgi:hypothetical protein